MSALARPRHLIPVLGDARSLALMLALSVAALAGAACDRPWDFDCTAEWGTGDMQISKTVYTYKQLKTEQEATAKCKEEMLKNKPKGAKSATCKCVGK